MDIPIAKLFMHNCNYYLYDTYSNRLFGVTECQYKELSQLLKIGINHYKLLNKDTKAYNDIIMLMRKGYLKSNIIDKIEHQDTKFINDFLDNALSNLVLQVTQKCNFSCRYCVLAHDTKTSRTHSNRNMTFEIAKKSIDFLYLHSSNSHSVTISFYGGEPLLNFTLIEKCVTYIESLFFTKDIRYIMTVNGSLLTDSVVSFLSKYRFKITVSLDGDKKTQNKHRRFWENGGETYDLVMKNIKHIRESYPDYFANYVSFCPVVIDDENYENVVKFFSDQGISKDKINPLKANLNGIDYDLSLLNINNSKLKGIDIETLAINERSVKDLHRIYSDKREISSTWHHNGPCIPGYHRLFVDVDGNFYPCEKMIENDMLVIGNIKKGFDKQKVKKFLNIGLVTEKECKNCWAAHFCQICISLCIDIDNKCISKEQKLKACETQKEVALWFLKNHVINQD